MGKISLFVRLWTRRMYHIYVIMALLFLIFEACLHINNRLPVVIITTSINIIGGVIGYVINRSFRFTQNCKNSTICILILTLFAESMIIHCHITSLYFLPVLVIFISTIYDQVLLTTILMLLSYIFLVLAAMVQYLSPTPNGPLMLTNLIVAIFIIFFSYITARFAMSFNVGEKEFYIESSNRERLLLKELNFDTQMGIYNQKAMEEYLFKEMTILHMHPGRGTEYSLLLIHIDQIRKMTETYGELRSDEVLLRLSDIIRKFMNKDIVAFRYEKNKVLLLVRDEPLVNVKRIMQETLNEFSKSRFGFAPNANFSLCVGIAPWKESYVTKDIWLSAAEDALLEAKKAGSNHIFVNK